MQQREHASFGSRVLLFAGLVLLWAMLWGQFTVLSLLTGIGVAAIVTILFYLPAIQFSRRLNPLRAAYFFVRLMVDILIASFQVAWIVLKPGSPPQNSIVAVQLRTRSDLITMWVAEALSLVPGSIVVDLDRGESILYLHVLDTDDDHDVEVARQRVLATEKRIVRGFGSAHDVELVCGRTSPPAPGSGFAPAETEGKR
ncbi:multisubunit sodium/proton antiporter MrpE subunit [Labedella gwakjiensis]|uniref:Multisubunit sodium/proton antiporter MrpE subunit n=1 Tax=Labedella gwakjiensis TaxID=390269 RepID=A0A2P8GRR2_9MICO|nr:Na+/H+ antiporter subunit E [Labedella gwakjiensis]PSL36651.1 multisubunit sodium/proton antiporter MrpE subunit [Labedella gwakjiensis]RUQ84174.1 Na+/H+ antiporter subunit E [Labedella gwakjiensis]